MKFARTALLVALSAVFSTALAGDIKPYDQQTFDTLTQAGKPLLLDVSATWCPTCKQQKPIVDAMMGQPAYKDVTTLTIDFDSNKDLLKKFKVSMQSTLIAFKGAKEVGRSVGDTTRDGIEGLIRKTVQQ